MSLCKACRDVDIIWQVGGRRLGWILDLLDTRDQGVQSKSLWTFSVLNQDHEVSVTVTKCCE